MSKLNILVTGGSGFIGSNLVEQLLQNGHTVVNIDNFNDFYNPQTKRDNIKTALQHPGYTLEEGDILDVELLDKVFTEPFDCVVHLAAYAGVRPSIENPQLYQRVNIEGTVNLLEQCRKNGIKKFVFASSSSVYGGQTTVPFKESDNVSKPISPYAATKAAGEVICHSYHHLFGINMNLLRFFTVYGPRQREEMAIHLFAKKMKTGMPIELFGDGRSSRDYTYITDIVDGIIASINNCNGFEILNLGGSKTTSLSQLISIIAKTLNVTPIIDHLPDQPGDVPITYADVTKAKKLLNYNPKVGIEEGITKFVQWLK